MIAALVILPLLGAIIAWLVPDNRLRPWLLPVFGMLHGAITVDLILSPPLPSLQGWIHLDPLGCLALVAISPLFLACSFYAVGYLNYRQERSNRILCMGLLVCLSAMSLTSVAHHLGLLWLALETTTLVMAPLVYFNRNARSLEATWKYMMICSVGIALALLGLFFLAYSMLVAGHEATLLLDQLVSRAGVLSPAWLHAAFVFILVGFGTKVGLAPLHTWKPDAYGEAPGIVGALLSGGLVTCGVLGLMRIYQVCIAAGDTTFYRDALVGLGLLSTILAAVFLVRQADFKRMLAYSSVEHVGVIAIGLGIGKGAIFFTLLHLLANSLTKGVLFLTAGNIHRSYNSKRCDVVHGVLRRLPWTGSLFLAGFFAGTASPPFGMFLSEFGIIAGSFAAGRPVVTTILVVSFAAAYLGMAANVLPMALGERLRESERTLYRDSFLTVAPPLLLTLILLLMGLCFPLPLARLVHNAAFLLGGE
ncbi:hydrogenase [Geobacter pelophilus]|uniref:Hydrogenase n=1 Tax=Geoanaerobacter pelophilus TaxID=60036 RepID=A0AAW4LB56_9BACT|nr:proton-conducting transporter membrane subunit [Geoanaerobacter pelophilus]MBT0665815.1 hydrogenase [Geoanaerobacter pelophilus]